MKRFPKILIILITSLIVSTSCSNHKSNQEEKTDISVDSNSTGQIEESTSLNSNSNTESANANITVKDEIIEVNNYEILDVDNITFDQKINNDETIKRLLFPTLFEGNTIYVLSEFYTQAENTSYQNEILSYDIISKDIERVSFFDFNIGYYPDFLFNDYYFSFPCTFTDKNELQINIVVSDTKEGNPKTIYQETVTSPYYYADYINNNEVVFLTFPQVDGRTYQKVLKYDLQKDEISTIYENEYIPSDDEHNVFENIWTFDTYNGNIYLLTTQVSNGERSWSVIEIDSSGNVLNKMHLSGLYDYSSVNCSVNQFVVTQNLYLIQFYDSGDNSNFVLITRGDENNCFKFEKLLPCTLVSPFLIKDRYLIYNTFPDYGDYETCYYSSDISIYDALEDTFYFFKINYKDDCTVEKIISNEYGDIILVVSNETDSYYTLVKDIISYIQHN